MKLNSPHVYERFVSSNPCPAPGCERGTIEGTRKVACRACGGTGNKPVTEWATADTPRELCEVCAGAKELEESVRRRCATCGGEGVIDQEPWILLPSGELIPDPSGRNVLLLWEHNHDPHNWPSERVVQKGTWFPVTICDTDEALMGPVQLLSRRCIAVHAKPMASE